MSLARASTSKVSRNIRFFSSVDVGSIPKFSTPLDAVQFAKDNLQDFTPKNLVDMCFKFRMTFQDAPYEQALEVKKSEDYNQFINHISQQLPVLNGVDAAEVFMKVAMLCPLKPTQQYKMMGQTMLKRVLSGDIVIPPSSLPNVLLMVCRTGGKDLSLVGFVRGKSAELVPQLDCRGCIQYVRLLTEMGLRDLETLGSIGRRLLEFSDEFTNMDVVGIINEFARARFFVGDLMTKCKALLQDHTSLFEYYELIACLKGLSCMDAVDARLLFAMLDEIKEKVRPNDCRAHCSLLGILTRINKNEGIFANELIGMIASTRDHAANVPNAISCAYAICNFELKDRVDVLRESLEFLMTRNIDSERLSALTDIFGHAKSMGVNVTPPASLSDMMSYHEESNSNSNFAKIISDTIRNLDGPYQMDGVSMAKIGGFMVHIVVEDSKLAILLEEARDDFGTSLRRKCLENLGYTTCRIQLDQWRRMRFDDAKREVIEKSLEPALVQIGRMSADTFAANKERRIQARRDRMGTSMTN